MAKITSVIATSHSPFLFEPVEWWLDNYNARVVKGGYAPDVPVDSIDRNVEKHRRVNAAYEALAKVFRESKPDVVVIFGDDQEEQFTSRNHPAFAVFVGEAFSGYRAVAYEGVLSERRLKSKTPENWTDVKAHSGLARSILKHLMRSDFDPAFMTALPNEAFGMGHAFMRPMQKLTSGRFDVPVVPILVNGLYPPQPTAMRCLKAAEVVRKAIEEWPEDMNVAVVGSGGLWHTPGSPEAYLDEDFDASILRYIEAGDAYRLARFFDDWKPSKEHADLKCFQAFIGKTGVEGGIGSGAGEVRNWIMAAGVAGIPGKIVDYVPVYASPCGMGFAHWEIA